MNYKLGARLFFSEKDISQITKRIKEERYEALWKDISCRAEKIAKAKSLVLEGDTFKIWYYVRNRLMDLSLCTLLTGEKKYVEALNFILFDLATQDMDFWQGPEYPNRPRTIVNHGKTVLAGELETAQIAMGVSIAFDWGYAYLKEETKSAVLKALKEKAQMLLRNSTQFQSEHWVMNHLCVLSTGLALSTTILENEGIPFESDLDLAEKGLNLWMNKIDYDGSYGESYHYWAYPTNCLFFGLYLFTYKYEKKLSCMHMVEKAFNWALYNQVGKYEIKGFDKPIAVAVNQYDSPFLFQMEAPEALLYANLFHNPVAKWYINKFLIDNPPRPDCLHHVWHKCNSILFALDDENLVPCSPEDYGFPVANYFADTGFVYLRDSWKNCGDIGGDTVFALQSGGGGRSCSHEHYDKNSISLFSKGEYFICDPGHSCYRGQSHKIFDTMTSSHNTLCVGGENQNLSFLEKGMLFDEFKFCRSFNNQALIVGKNFNSKVLFVASDAKRSYKPELKAFTRKVWFVNSSYFVILDYIDVGDISKKAEIGFNINNYDNLSQLDIENNNIRVNRPNSDMNMSFLWPNELDFEKEPSKLHLAYHVLPDQKVEGKLGSAIRLIPKVKGKSQNIINYLYVIQTLDKNTNPFSVSLTEIKTEGLLLKKGKLIIKTPCGEDEFKFEGNNIMFNGCGNLKYQY